MNTKKFFFFPGFAFLVLAISVFAAEGGNYVTKANSTVTVDGILTFVGFLILGGMEIFSVHHAKKESRKDRTLTILNRYFHKDLLPSVESAWEFIHDSRLSQSDKLNDFHNNPQIRANLIEVFNFFEEIGLMYNTDLLDKKIVKRCLGPIILEYFIQSQCFIRSLRKTHPFAETYIEWENMISGLSKRVDRENSLNVKMFQLTLHWKKTQSGLRTIERPR
ncbi:MAG TPA: hypothetical protein VHT73_15800 [Thermodesulfobacteriota bacterium]|nr:hypothetical protein [Thermodesulfobacteriota bacterium]